MYSSEPRTEVCCVRLIFNINNEIDLFVLFSLCHFFSPFSRGFVNLFQASQFAQLNYSYKQTLMTFKHIFHSQIDPQNIMEDKSFPSFCKWYLFMLETNSYFLVRGLGLKTQVYYICTVLKISPSGWSVER